MNRPAWQSWLKIMQTDIMFYGIKMKMYFQVLQ